MSKFIMLVGLPASGKSTYAYSGQLKDEGFNIHSSDLIREELLGDSKDQTGNQKVFQTLHKRIKDDLAKGVNTVYDATNISYKRRMAFLREIERFKSKKICVFFATPYEDCITRDSLREFPVGEEVIKKMYKNIWIPQREEGWDEIEVILDYKRGTYDLKTFLDSLKDYDQDTPFHELTLGQHMHSTYIKIYKNLMEPRIDLTRHENLLLAAKMHDIGKPFTRDYDEEKERATYYQHHLTGGYDALFYLSDSHFFEPLTRMSIQEEMYIGDIMEVCGLIQWHMYPYNVKQESTRIRFLNTVGKDRYEKIMFLHKADKEAH